MAKNIEEKQVILDEGQFLRLANNFYNSIQMEAEVPRYGIDAQLLNYVLANQDSTKKKLKVALICICLNPPYWQYAQNMILGARQFFLPGHQTDILFWSDMPEKIEDENVLVNQLTDVYRQPYAGKLYPNEQLDAITQATNNDAIKTVQFVKSVRDMPGVSVFPTESIEWPFPTLLRYNLFLQQEEKLKDYDYIFYCDVDMQFANVVGDEILGLGLTVAPHPGYATKKEMWPPYEPNPDSASYIKRPGKVVIMDGKPRFMPFYCAGGFQGGTSETFIKAMKETKNLIDKDLSKNYIPIWNDETAWNKFVFDLQTDEEISRTVFLTPAYIYPDSLINEYYTKIWGRNYQPKLITLTKKFSLVQMDNKAMNNLLGP